MGRVYRRVCFLRLEGRPDEARRVEETELAAAEARVRASGLAGLEVEEGLRGLHAEEEGRVAEAIAFAEVLVPALSERLAGMGAARPAAPAVRPSRPAPKAMAPGIADFIDEMLVRERTASR